MAFLNPYLNFNGECKEAMNFYKDCIGGELTLQTVAETPMAAQCPAGMQDQVMHAMLLKDKMCLMASDMVGPQGYIKGTNFSISVNCGSEAEINKFFAALSAGGQVIDPLKTQFWGAIFGVFTDKFGIRWMLNYDKSMADH
jgi:PhnB protein